MFTTDTARNNSRKYYWMYQNITRQHDFVLQKKVSQVAFIYLISNQLKRFVPSSKKSIAISTTCYNQISRVNLAPFSWSKGTKTSPFPFTTKLNYRIHYDTSCQRMQSMITCSQARRILRGRLTCTAVPYGKPSHWQHFSVINTSVEHTQHSRWEAWGILVVFLLYAFFKRRHQEIWQDTGSL